MAQPIEFDSNSDGSVSAYPEKRPSIKVREPLLSEVLTKVHGAKTKAQKVKILQEEDCLALRQICQWSFNPKIESELPSGTPPFMENDAPEGTEHMLLRTEVIVFGIMSRPMIRVQTQTFKVQLENVCLSDC